MRRVIDRVRDDSGLTVIELVIASALSLVILLSLLAVLDSGTRAERGAQARQSALVDLRQVMTRASKDIRQATSVNSASTLSRLDMQTFVLGEPTRMIYEASGGRFLRSVCTNFDFAATCGGAATEMAGSVTTSQPFCYNPPDCDATAPTSVMNIVRIQLAGSPDVSASAPITLATDIQLRNM